MMKKWFLFLMLVLTFTIKESVVKADADYKSYEEITIYGGKFLSDFTDSELKKEYKKVDKRKFWGWRINEVNKDCKVVYKTETLFSYLNDGYSPINYEYSTKSKRTKSVSLSSTGTISIDLSGTVEKFKGGLSTSLKIVETEKEDFENIEETKLKTSVDPGTMLNLFIMGEGKITNGVAVNYRFWLKRYRGGFEVFTVTTQNFRLEKVKVWWKKFLYQ